MIPQEVVQIRRNICEDANCNMLSQLNFADPCAVCPNGHWSKYSLTDCPSTALPPPLPPSFSSKSNTRLGLPEKIRNYPILEPSGTGQSQQISILSPLSLVQNAAVKGGIHPGAIFSSIIFKITGQIPGPNCACNARKNQMDQWGWFGCWKNRKIIIQWLVEEAAKRGHNVEEGDILSLLKAAFKEMRQKKDQTSANRTT